MRKTKIVCTLGPATDKEGVLRGMLKAGMNVARFNFSHGDHAGHKARLDALKALREEMDLPVATMLDTKGPEVRLKTFKNGPVELKGDLTVEGNVKMIGQVEIFGELFVNGQRYRPCTCT